MTSRGERKRKPFIYKMSDEEKHICNHAEAWGRKRFPGARMVYQFPLPRMREDKSIPRLSMAFIGERSIAGIIVKTSKSILHDLPQKGAYALQYLPELWVFADVRHEVKLREGHSFFVSNCGLHIVGADGFEQSPEFLNTFGSRDEPHLYAPMLNLLTRPELVTAARRNRIELGLISASYDYITRLSADLAGEQIRREVCRELRARTFGWPVNLPGDPAIPIPLFGGAP